MRARLAIAASGCQCELREVVLRNKPPSLLAVSPKATVPVLIDTNGAVIDESLDIMLWALRQNDPGRRSEEPTSELQSLMRTSYAVFCLQKKKYNNTTTR